MIISKFNYFRPLKLNEVVGQDPIVEILSSMIERKQFFPVVILSGPRGTGKTSIARILSRILNCDLYYQTENPTDEMILNDLPCNVCDSCKLSEFKKTMDILEIDGATYTGVDNMRNVIESVYHLPIVLKNKVVIIDEVQMLSKGAFNSLLKTLEEPPQHVYFFLLTTEDQKIPETIVSRSLNLHTRLLNVYTISKILNQIDKKLKISEKKKPFSQDVIDLICLYSEGSVRDALVLFESVCNLKKQDVRSVTRAFGSCSIHEAIPVYIKIVEGNLMESKKLWLVLEEDGVTPIRFLKLLVRIVGLSLKKKWN